MIFTWVVVGVYILLPGSCEIGYRLGSRAHARARDDATRKAHASTWQSALLALSGLLIGFTFSMAQGRYETRKQIIFDEANHIGTTYLRTRLLDDASGQELRGLLRRYVDVRLAFHEGGADRVQMDELLRQGAALEDRIWTTLTAASRADPHSTTTPLLVQSTNDMFDAGEEELAAIATPLPITVFLVLIMATGVAMASTGFVCGLEARRSGLGMLIMPVLLAMVIALIFDLAHPRIGIVRIPDPILLRLKQSF